MLPLTEVAVSEARKVNLGVITLQSGRQLNRWRHRPPAAARHALHVRHARDAGGAVLCRLCGLRPAAPATPPRPERFGHLPRLAGICAALQVRRC